MIAGYTKSPNPHCAHASVLGGGVCGTTTTAVQDFCNNLNLLCTVAVAPSPSLYPYTDVATCINVASTFSVTNIGAEWGVVNSTYNDLGCRAYYGGMPALVNPNTYCPQAGASSPMCTGVTPTTMSPTTKHSDAASLSAILALIASILVLLL